jgi:hypothetical protein
MQGRADPTRRPASGRIVVAPVLGDCTINKGGFEFPTGTGYGRSSAAIGNQGLTQTAA